MPNTMSPRVHIAKILCESLDNNDIPWCITHGAEGYPDHVGRDFDILIPKAYHDRAATLIQDTARIHNWDSLLIPLKWAGSPVIMWKLDNEALHCFEMHFIDVVDWCGCILADYDHSKSIIRNNGLAIASWPSFAKRVLLQIHARCWNRIEERVEEFSIAPNEEHDLQERMTNLYGTKSGHELLQFIRNKDISSIKSKATEYSLRLLFRAAVKKSDVKLSIQWLYGKICRLLGLARWRPPFIVLFTPRDLNHTPKEIAAEITSILGFAKSITLNGNNNNVSLYKKVRELWRIHIHRSLFRLVILQIESGHNAANFIISSIGYRAYSSGAFIVHVEHWDSNRLNFEFHEAGKTISLKSNEKIGSPATLIAYKYLACLKKTYINYS